MESSKKRGNYIKGDASDWIIREIIAKKELLLHYNPSGKAGGAALRKNASEEVASAFNARFPECGGEKTYSQIKEHFDSRRDGIKKILASVNAYTTGTGGGRDPQAEAMVAKLSNSSETDNLLISLLKRTPGVLGVGDKLLETGHTLDVLMQGGMGEEADEPCGSRLLPKTAKKKKSLTMGGLKKAQEINHVEWLKAATPLIAANAARLGFRGGNERMMVKREREREGEEDGETFVKKRKEEEDPQLAKLASSVDHIQKQMSSYYEKGQAAIAAVEQLRAIVLYGGDGDSVPKSILSSLLANYDASVSGRPAKSSIVSLNEDGRKKEGNPDIIHLG